MKTQKIFYPFCVLFLLFSLLDIVLATVQDPTSGRCIGTSSGLSVGENRLEHYSKMYKRYRNCTIVKGNLEITGLVNPELDISFLKDIEEVTGYVVIALNFVPYLPLEKLKIIRGRELFKDRYALHVSINMNEQDSSQGLRELRLKSLTEIVSGGVKMKRNNHLCFTNTINWDDILRKETRNMYRVSLEDTPPPSCGSCDVTCGGGGCWGRGASMCQVLTSTICSEQCGNARCKGPAREDCCDIECASGCTGPSDKDCITCLHVNNTGACEYTCPPARIYDPLTQRNIPNPHFKFHYHDHCVDACPSNLLVEDNGCVKSCRRGLHNDGTGKCVQCSDELCSGDKECYGVNHQDGPLANIRTVNSSNVHYFQGCNIIKGNLIFQSFVFVGDNHTGLAPMNISQLEVFRSVRVITGYLKIVSWPGNLTDFSIFENLEQIDGFNLYKDLAALVIQDNVHANGPSYLMQIQSLGFRSLRAINHGNVYIGYLRNLCFDKAVNWTSMIKDPQSYRGFLNGILLRKNKPASQCNVSSLCDEQCNSNGCWGFGPTQCLQCKNFSFNGTCLSTCHKEMGITFADGENECVRCHSQCKDTCRGIGPRNCTECLVYDHNGTCTDECPMDKYPHPVTKTCERCHSFCAVHRGDPMCFGPNNTLGENGCHRCYTALTTRGFDVTQCMPAGAPCPTGYFIHDSSSTLILERQTCMPCYEGCNNCTGVAREDCLHALSSSQEFTAAIVVPVAVVVCALLFCIFFGCRYRRKQIQKKRTQSMRKLGIDPHSPEEQNMDPRVRLMEPMTPSGVAPNQAQLRIVKEAELRIGKILGSGAFGTVHKGYWIPDLAPRERVKVPVAIKVLRDESSQVASNEILDEAFVMASCEHPNLVRLLGISLSQRIMLITQLMPLGNLLEYVRDNKDNIGSQHLLNWSLQIAKGMKYLSEEKHLVHRDLAARNVLVKSPNHVRITDFGLAKLLDVKEDVYRAEGGKMPIKWLALESIQHRIFTQKSDVWSFGVTMWELMTFGKKPYESVPAREVHTLLERGERLPQPYICTIDIYMLLIKCWTVDAEARPTFKELTEELSKLARDPQRYLVIDNDGLLTDLPSPTTSEFLRSLVNDEGDDFPITDAEEYLHPQPLEGTENPLNSNQFSLQPVPTMVPWKRQHHQQHLSSTSSQQGLLGSRGSGSGRFVHPNRSADRRLDSVMTTMTNLSSVSGSLPNGASTPFSPVAMGLNPEDDDDREVVLGATGDSLQGPIIHYNALAAPENFRSFSESSDAVFAPSPLIKHDRGYRTNRMDEGCSTPEQQSRYLRAREDSTTMRYSAEPVSLMRQQTKPNEYLDPSEFPPSPFALKPPVNIFDSVRTPTSALANPEYEPSFVPSDCESGTAGNTQDTFDEDDREYQNIVPNGVTVIPDQHQLQIGLRRGSQSEESVNSEKRDSGLQTDEEDDKKALDVKATSVANPEYDYLGDVTSGGSENPGSPGNNQNSPPSPNFVPNETEYINDSVAPKSGPNHQNGFAEDEIFSALTLADPKMRERVLYGKNSAGRTYSEPDSGVGIEVAMDNILYHKLGPNWDTTE